MRRKRLYNIDRCSEYCFWLLVVFSESKLCSFDTNNICTKSDAHAQCHGQWRHQYSMSGIRAPVMLVLRKFGRQEM
jgi:hypothetical protein